MLFLLAMAVLIVVCGVVGGGLGVAIPFWLATQNPDPAAGGAYSAIAFLTAPLGFLVGVLIGMFIAFRLWVKRRPTT